MGIEPTYKGFADLSLTTWVPRRKAVASAQWPVTATYIDKDAQEPRKDSEKTVVPCALCFMNANLERETGFEPATSTLARSHSTAELLPLDPPILHRREDSIQTGKPALKLRRERLPRAWRG